MQAMIVLLIASFAESLCFFFFLEVRHADVRRALHLLHIIPGQL